MVLADLTRLTGMPCTTPLGQLAADHLAERVLGAGAGPILVVRDGVTGRYRPARRLRVLSRKLVEQQDGPDVAAGYRACREAAQQPRRTRWCRYWPCRPARDTSPADHRDRFPKGRCRAMRETMLRVTAAPVPESDCLRPSRRPPCASSPYAYASTPAARLFSALIEADPFRGKATPPVLPDETGSACRASATRNERRPRAGRRGRESGPARPFVYLMIASGKPPLRASFSAAFVSCLSMKGPASTTCSRCPLWLTSPIATGKPSAAMRFDAARRICPITEASDLHIAHDGSQLRGWVLSPLCVDLSLRSQSGASECHATRHHVLSVPAWPNAVPSRARSGCQVGHPSMPACSPLGRTGCGASWACDHTA